MEQEKKTIIDNIKSLNRSYVDVDKWRDNITHVVYFAKHDKFGMTEKVMSAIAAGWWVVTKRYVEKSFKQGSWIPSLKLFTWSPRVLERREALFREGVIKGGLFWTMKAVFIMEDKTIKDVFGRIIIAGGGSVVRYYNTLESLAKNPPSVQEITHCQTSIGLMCVEDTP